MMPAKSLQKDTLQQITAKIRQATTADELRRIEKSCDRLYSAGLLTLQESWIADNLLTTRLSRIRQ